MGGLNGDKLCDALQRMAPTNVKTVHQTFSFLTESNLGRLGWLSPTHGQRSRQQSGQIMLQSVSRPEKKENCNTELHGVGDLELVKSARKAASSRPKSSASLENAPERLPVGRSLLTLIRRKRTVVRGQISHQKPLAHRGSAFTWLVDDRAALRSRQTWCLLTQQYTQQRACACCGALPQAFMTVDSFPTAGYSFFLRPCY